jgi:hypothetical protein
VYGVLAVVVGIGVSLWAKRKRQGVVCSHAAC